MKKLTKRQKRSLKLGIWFNVFFYSTLLLGSSLTFMILHTGGDCVLVILYSIMSISLLALFYVSVDQLPWKKRI